MLRSWLASLFRNIMRRDAVENDLDEELRSYVALLADEKASRGVPEQAAHRAATIEVGGLDPIREAVHDQRAGIGVERLIRDARYGMRMAIRNPSVAAVVILTLGVGIGATTTVFSAVDAVLLRPLPFPQADRLVMVSHYDRNTGTAGNTISPGNLLEWRDRSGSFASMASIEPFSLEILSDGEPENVRIWRVSEGFFDTLGVPAAHGRTFTSEEYQPGAGSVIVLGHRFWQQRFGGDRSVVGRTLAVSSRPYVVVGVMPPEFEFPPGRDLWVPRALTAADRQNRDGAYLTAIGRLKPGVSVEAAGAELRGIADRLSQEFPTTNGRIGASLVSLSDRLVGHVRPYLILLIGAVAFVLLITCVNVANVLLARGAARTPELALRTAVGAPRRQLFSQLLVENLVLALAGGALGVITAHWGLRGLIALAPADVPRLADAGINATVLAFAVGLSCLTALLFGVLPASQLSKVEANAALREGPRGTGRAVSERTRRALVIGEVALALALLTGTTLLLRSFVNLLRVDPGFSSAHVVALPVFLFSQYPTDDERAAFFEETLQRIEALPHVTAAGAASRIPFHEVLGDTRTMVTIEGRPTSEDARPTIAYTVATPGYLRTMGIAVLRGRAFSHTDSRGTTPVVVINETMARRFWPDEDPVGGRIRISDGPVVDWEIIGIVRDTRDSALEAAAEPTVMLPYPQYPVGQMTYVVRTDSDSANVVGSVKAAVWSVNKQLPFRQTTTLRDLVAASIAPRQFVLVLMGVFGVVGLFLAAVGLFGIVNYLVVRRTREIDLRIALGAAPQGIVRSLVAEGLRLAGTGAAIGVIGAMGLTQLLSRFLFGVEPMDPLAVTGAILVVLLVAGIASYLPARRAARLSPMLALRSQ